MISNGQFIKVIFRNGTTLEGFVKNWSDTKATLTSEDKTTSLIIMNVSEDVMLIKIMEPPKTIKELENETIKLEEEFEEVKAAPSADELRLQKLADLKKLMIEQDKKIVSEKVKTHTSEGPQPVQYKYPSFILKEKK